MPESEDWPAGRPGPDRNHNRGPDRDTRTGGSAAAARIQHQNQWVDQQIRVAMERGEFDNLPGYGKPLEDLDGSHDPDWWLKKLIEREQVTGVLPPALMLRKEDLELDAQLDRETAEKAVRTSVEDFNRRIVNARRQLEGGPPVVTATRDVDAEVAAWHERRTARREAQRLQLAADEAQAQERRKPRRRWFRR